jgi:uracil-DNA glycosylase
MTRTGFLRRGTRQGAAAAAAAEAAGGDRLAAWSPEQWPVAEGWRDLVDGFLGDPAGQQLASFLRQRLADGAVIYPPRPLRALELTPLASVHVLILGQDPYHGPGQAEGLAFSVPDGVRLPPSLRNIFREAHGTDAEVPARGSLAGWARQGVLLLNTSLTVEHGLAGSHGQKGWESLTDALVTRVAATASPCVYMLWGAQAQARGGLIERTALQQGREYLLLRANHPSPLSAHRPPIPFVGCDHFRQAREWLAARGKVLDFAGVAAPVPGQS